MSEVTKGFVGDNAEHRYATLQVNGEWSWWSPCSGIKRHPTLVQILDATISGMDWHDLYRQLYAISVTMRHLYEDNAEETMAYLRKLREKDIAVARRYAREKEKYTNAVRRLMEELSADPIASAEELTQFLLQTLQELLAATPPTDAA